MGKVSISDIKKAPTNKSRLTAYSLQKDFITGGYKTFRICSKHFDPQDIIFTTRSSSVVSVAVVGGEQQQHHLLQPHHTNQRISHLRRGALPLARKAEGGQSSATYSSGSSSSTAAAASTSNNDIIFTLTKKLESQSLLLKEPSMVRNLLTVYC